MMEVNNDIVELPVPVYWKFHVRIKEYVRKKEKEAGVGCLLLIRMFHAHVCWMPS